jgi:Ca2+-binding EF-hand superfamily protein
MVAAGAAIAADAPADAEPPRIGPAEIIASNDLDKDGIVTRDEAKKNNGNLSVMWDVYDMDHDGRVNLAEVTRATGEMATGTALQKITGSSGGRLAMRDPKLIVESNDLDKDGTVTREEATKHNGSLNRMWDSYDLNKDGKTDAAEIAKASRY